MSLQYGCVVVCVNVLACGQPKCKQCWTTGQSDFLVRDWLMMLMMSSTSGGSENANLYCFWWRSSQVSIVCPNLVGRKRLLQVVASQYAAKLWSVVHDGKLYTCFCISFLWEAVKVCRRLVESR